MDGKAKGKLQKNIKRKRNLVVRKRKEKKERRCYWKGKGSTKVRGGTQGMACDCEEQESDTWDKRG